MSIDYEPATGDIWEITYLEFPEMTLYFTITGVTPEYVWTQIVNKKQTMLKHDVISFVKSLEDTPSIKNRRVSSDEFMAMEVHDL